MIRLLIYAVPNELKLVAINSTSILAGERARVQLNLLKFAVFIKRSKLILCSSCMCYAATKLINLIKGLNGAGYKALFVSNNLELGLGFSHKILVAAQCKSNCVRS
ncbi:50S ribosomal protein L6 [Candidatus Hodgkinia cicadicola]|nr:50S ribosomal protein L6 [Candidatus Hodgkinia cicadicola]